jgi:DnaK suppressor protein
VLTSAELAELEGKLLDAQAELLGVADFFTDSRETLNSDQSELGRSFNINPVQKPQAQGHVVAAQQRDARALQAITDALVRIDEGTFGVCVSCDKHISIRHLRLAPQAPHCLSCE